MIDDLIPVFTFLSALGCGVMAGFFFAFSAGVMRALARLPASNGIAAMQLMNITVINPLFIPLFLGTAASCLTLSVFALLRWHNPGAIYLLIGGLLYLVGSVAVTFIFNVPRNNALAVIEPASAGAQAFWTNYVKVWTAWNHVRAVAALAAAALLVIAFYGATPK